MTPEFRTTVIVRHFCMAYAYRNVYHALSVKYPSRLTVHTSLNDFLATLHIYATLGKEFISSLADMKRLNLSF